jgi:hypothetical protein
VEKGQQPDIMSEDEEGAFLHYVREKVDLLKRRQALGKVENSTGFLMEAIRKNYANPEFGMAEKQKETHRRREDKAARERKLERLKDEKIELERARRDEARAVCKDIIQASPELAEEAAKALAQEVQWFKNQYDPGRSVLENYQKVPGLWVEMDKYLEEHHAERFGEIQEKYDGQLEDIGKKIAELEQADA